MTTCIVALPLLPSSLSPLFCDLDVYRGHKKFSCFFPGRSTEVGIFFHASGGQIIHIVASGIVVNIIFGRKADYFPHPQQSEELCYPIHSVSQKRGLSDEATTKNYRYVRR